MKIWRLQNPQTPIRMKLLWTIQILIWNQDQSLLSIYVTAVGGKKKFLCQGVRIFYEYTSVKKEVDGYETNFCCSTYFSFVSIHTAARWMQNSWPEISIFQLEKMVISLRLHRHQKAYPLFDLLAVKIWNWFIVTPAVSRA